MLLTEDEMENKDEDSIMNVGRDFLKSIQNDLNEGNRSAKSGDYSAWRSALDCINRKITRRQDAEEEKNIRRIIIILDNVSAMYYKKLNRRNGISKRTSSLGQEVANLMAEYEKALIGVLDRINWLVPYEKEMRRPY